MYAAELPPSHHSIKEYKKFKQSYGFATASYGTPKFDEIETKEEKVSPKKEIILIIFNVKIKILTHFNIKA
jgi:hypothetical protein